MFEGGLFTEKLANSRVPNYFHMFFGVFFVSFLLFLYFTSLVFIEMSFLVQVITFNFLFVFTLFPLKGRLTRKVCLLLFGNFVGFVWDFFFKTFVQIMVMNFHDYFKIFYVIIYPLFNSLWIVSIWSLSLSLLAVSKKQARTGNR